MTMMMVVMMMMRRTFMLGDAHETLSGILNLIQGLTPQMLSIGTFHRQMSKKNMEWCDACVCVNGMEVREAKLKV